MSQSMPPNYDERNREESISARVYREIKNKILQLDYLPGSYLTEARLAEEYGVSRMPVRIAIQKLSSEGWLLDFVIVYPPIHPTGRRSAHFSVSSQH